MTLSTLICIGIANFALHAPLISDAFHIASPLSSIRPITSRCSGTGAAFLNTGNMPFTCMRSKRSQSLLQTPTTSSTARGLLGNDDNMNMYAPEGDDDDDDDIIEIAGTADMEALRYRIARNKKLGPGLEGCDSRPDNVFIILFYPDTPDEGAHTIELPKGSGNNLLLAFECEMECNRFAAFLEDQKFFDPSPRDIALDGLEQYCKTIGVEVHVVPKGTDLIPPTEKADNFDHNPYLKQEKSSLNKLFEMDSELENVEGKSTLNRLFEMDGDRVLKEGGTLLSEEEEISSWE